MDLKNPCPICGQQRREIEAACAECTWRPEAARGPGRLRGRARGLVGDYDLLDRANYQFSLRGLLFLFFGAAIVTWGVRYWGFEWIVLSAVVLWYLVYGSLMMAQWAEREERARDR